MKSICLAICLIFTLASAGRSQHAESAMFGTGDGGCDLCHRLHVQDGGEPVSEFMLLIARDLDVFDTRTTRPSLAVGSSRSCLRCHSSQAGRENAMRSGRNMLLPPGEQESFIGPDLADDHPIGRSGRSESLGVTPDLDPDAANRQALTAIVAYSEASDGVVSCTSCHDPHQRVGQPGIASSGEWADLCADCHPTSAYAFGAHETVDCSGCHQMHGGAVAASLVNAFDTELLCRSCHDSSGAISDAITGGFESIAGMSGHDRPPGDDCLVCHPAH